MKTSIHYSEEICKRLEAKKLTETISPYAMEYINTIMLAVDKYQIRSANGIKHFWLSFVFDYAQNGGDKSALLENIA